MKKSRHINMDGISDRMPMESRSNKSFQGHGIGRSMDEDDDFVDEELPAIPDDSEDVPPIIDGDFDSVDDDETDQKFDSHVHYEEELDDDDDDFDL